MPQSNVCEVCGSQIELMARKGTGICSENCQKKKAGQVIPEHESEGHHASE